jgi:hypothetical protein
MKTKTRKLALSRETLHTLSLASVTGGTGTRNTTCWISCNPSYCGSCVDTYCDSCTC